MRDPAIETILILQDRDTRRVALETQIKATPVDIALVERNISDEKSALENARTELRELESKKKLLETEIGSAETTLGKYRTQQLAVRKNDEYQALGHEIETVQGQISEFEGRELEIMFAIDGAKKKFAAAEAASKQNIVGHEARIRTLRERGESLAGELKIARDEVAAARAPVAAPWLRAYERMAVRGLPAVVPIHGGKCGGCHLKVSSEVESAARGKNSDGLPAFCDQCNRIVYWEA
jgi:predicted  nucleic acid-binding Zn-ribbon protein